MHWSMSHCMYRVTTRLFSLGKLQQQRTRIVFDRWLMCWSEQSPLAVCVDRWMMCWRDQSVLTDGWCVDVTMQSVLTDGWCVAVASLCWQTADVLTWPVCVDKRLICWRGQFVLTDGWCVDVASLCWQAPERGGRGRHHEHHADRPLNQHHQRQHQPHDEAYTRQRLSTAGRWI